LSKKSFLEIYRFFIEILEMVCHIMVDNDALHTIFVLLKFSQHPFVISKSLPDKDQTYIKTIDEAGG
jgi:hypothetical protein